MQEKKKIELKPGQTVYFDSPEEKEKCDIAIPVLEEPKTETQEDTSKAKTTEIEAEIKDETQNIEEDNFEEIFETMEEEKKSQEKIQDTKKEEEDELLKLLKTKKSETPIQIINDENGELETKNMTKLLYGRKIIEKVTLAHSGYSLNMSPLANKDVMKLFYDNGDRYTSINENYKTVYDKIASFSFENELSYEDWLSKTSYEDLESLHYGLFCSSFQGESDILLPCDNALCKNQESDDFEFTYNLKSSSLIKIKDKNAFIKRLKEINSQSSSLEKVNELSYVGKETTITLPNSEVVVVLHSPSLKDTLDLFLLLSSADVETYKNYLTLSLYTKKLLFKQGNSTYIEKTNKDFICKVLDNLSLDDYDCLKKSVESLIERDKVEYCIENVICPYCKHEMKKVVINMEDLLFFQILGRYQ